MITNIIFFIFTSYSIFAGIKFGFGDSHTPPPTFVISSLLVILGIIPFLKKKFFFKNKLHYHIHLALTTINLFIVLYCLLLTII